MGKPKTQTSIRLSERQLAKLDAWALHKDSDRSKILRELIDALPMPGDKSIGVEQALAILEILRRHSI